ncbi:uncharacterized protein METZ01_LOCUS80010 [marine metagenome]|uniref:Uncharacterized protein n=1 Tax=marine metagenome TaxID=408172 RepID=A0A381UG27_9ZZZZ
MIYSSPRGSNRTVQWPPENKRFESYAM